MEFFFKRKRLNSKKKEFEREPTEKKLQKIQTPMFEKNKILAKAKEVFKRKVFWKKN